MTLEKRDGSTIDPAEVASQAAHDRAAVACQVNVPTAHGDFRMLWAGQSLNLLGDRFMVLALPLLTVVVLGASAAQAALLPFAFFVPFLLFGLPAGAILDRLPRRSTMVVCDTVQLLAFLAMAALAATRALTVPLLLLLVGISGTAAVFFQVAYNSYLPTLFGNPKDLQRGNARLLLSGSLSSTLGPMISGPVIAFVGVVWAIAANAGTFFASALSLLLIRHREPKGTPQKREPGWIYRDIREGLRFVYGHPQLEPVIACGVVYVLFLSMVDASMVLYAHSVLGLDAVGIGVVIGAAAAGFPVGNLLSGRLADRLGVPTTLVLGAVVSVTGLVLMPIAGSAGSTIGFVAGSVVHGVGEGAFGPCAVTLRQTATPASLLGRVNSVQRFFTWGVTPVGSLLASLTIALTGVGGAMWVGGVGTVLCLPVLLRRGIRAALWQGHAPAPPVTEAELAN